MVLYALLVLIVAQIGESTASVFIQHDKNGTQFLEALGNLTAYQNDSNIQIKEMEQDMHYCLYLRLAQASLADDVIQIRSFNTENSFCEPFIYGKLRRIIQVAYNTTTMLVLVGTRCGEIYFRDSINGSRLYEIIPLLRSIDENCYLTKFGNSDYSTLITQRITNQTELDVFYRKVHSAEVQRAGITRGLLLIPLMLAMAICVVLSNWSAIRLLGRDRFIAIPGGSALGNSSGSSGSTTTGRQTKTKSTPRDETQTTTERKK